MDERFNKLTLVDKDEAEEERAAGRPRMLLIGGIAVLVLAVILAVFLILQGRKPYTRAVLVDQSEHTVSGEVSCRMFGGALLRYSSSGAALMQTDGKELWNHSYSMINPVVCLQGDYGAIADLNGTNLIIFNKEGVTGNLYTDEPILAFSVSGYGVAAVALDRNLTSVIRFYDKKASLLDIVISLEMSESGYPLAMALSPEGSGLLLSVVTSSLGELNSQLVFYNFSVGKSDSNRLIGYYNYEGTLFPKVEYLSDKTAVAVGDDRLEIFSLEQENKPQQSQEILFDGELQDFASGNGYIATILPDPGSGQMRLSVRNTAGKEMFNQTVKGTGYHLQLAKDGVLLVTDTGVRYWNYKGRLRFEGMLEKSGHTVFSIGSKTLVQFDGGRIFEYELR